MKIEKLDLVVTDLPTRVQRTVFSGSYDTGPPGALMGKPVLVRLHAGGVVGYGQVRPISPGHFVPETTQSVVAAIRDVYGPCLLGRDVFHLEQLRVDFDLLLPGNANARAAIDFALHDAMGKATGLPAYQLLGGLCQQRIPLEWSISMAAEPGPMVDDAVRAVEQYGIRVLCVKAGSPDGWTRDVRNFQAVREAVGDDIVIGIDPNTGWTVSDTLCAMQALAPMGLGYVEQPVARRDIRGLARIRRSSPGVPIMADESLFTLEDAYELAAAEAVDVLCIKLYKTGGIAPAKRISAVAVAANLRVNVGGLAVQSQLEAAAGAHFYASTPAAHVMPAAEFLFGLGVTGADPLVADTTFAVRDGHVEVPAGPGLGIVVNEAAVSSRALLTEEVRSS